MGKTRSSNHFILQITVGIVQSVRTSVCGSEGRGFESLYPPHINKIENAKFKMQKPVMWLRLFFEF